MLYALVAFVVFVSVLFPYKELQQRLMEWASRDGVQLVLTRLPPEFASGVRAESTVVYKSPSSAPVMRRCPLRLSASTLSGLPCCRGKCSGVLRPGCMAGIWKGRRALPRSRESRCGKLKPALLIWIWPSMLCYARTAKRSYVDASAGTRARRLPATGK